MKWFSSSNLKQLKIFGLASGVPTALLVLAGIGNGLVNKGIISRKIFIIGLSTFLILFVVALVVYAADKKKN